MSTKQKFLLCISLIFCAFSFTLFLLIFTGNYGTTYHPDFDKNAKEGTPAVNIDLGYSPISHEGMPWSAHICGVFAPKTENGKTFADVYFTNDSGNTDYLMMQVLDEKDTILGQTGLIQPNQYIERIPLRSCPASGEPVKIKIVSFQPKTYYNNGNIILNTVVS